ncbi:hypothetical protein RND71_025442 [Anisodus tanguticus]|uniref:Signal peptide peptidase n=1 Tax=Anisodus tanguticus TaxID=243964 RepID=A0AAE1VAD8_9SOLA|nr:hypothetical protein RND71_025442 [Anisodus tanguticus]
MKNIERLANVALLGLSLAPLVVNVDPNVNVIVTACLTVFVGCCRSVKPTPPSETMSSEHAMRFPLVGSAMLLSLFLLFKFLSKDLVNALLTCYFFVLGIAALSYVLSAGLFVYDIFWVFFTPVMVSVAKSFDAPIKLLFPIADAKRPFSMLGLGDIVIPGIFVALALRFDVSRGKEPQYFKSAFLGYTFGLALTIFVMNWFQAAQPALLYIVPAVIGFLAVHCLWNGDVKPLLEFDEGKTKGAEEADAKESKKLVQSLDIWGLWCFYVERLVPYLFLSIPPSAVSGSEKPHGAVVKETANGWKFSTLRRLVSASSGSSSPVVFPAPPVHHTRASVHH